MVVADGLVQVIDKDMGDVKIAGVQTADQALQHVNVLDAVLFGINQADLVVHIVGQLLAVLDADDVAGLSGDCILDGVDDYS